MQGKRTEESKEQKNSMSFFGAMKVADEWSYSRMLNNI